MTQAPTKTTSNPTTTRDLPRALVEPTRAELREFFASHPRNDLVVISNHAVDRYRKRFRPSLDIEEARKVVYGAMRVRGQFTPIPPEWLFHVSSIKGRGSTTIGYIVIDDELAMPLRQNTPRRNPPGARQEQAYVAVTCLYRVLI